MNKKPEPSAEDWVIMRLLDGWLNDMGGLSHSMTAKATGYWMVEKLGIKTVMNMIDQLKQEKQK